MPRAKGSIVKPITDLIDNLTTSDEEKLSLKNELVKLQNDVAVKVIDYQSKLLDSQTRLIEAEAKGKSWFVDLVEVSGMCCRETGGRLQ